MGTLSASSFIPVLTAPYVYVGNQRPGLCILPFPISSQVSAEHKGVFNCHLDKRAFPKTAVGLLASENSVLSKYVLDNRALMRQIVIV